MNRITNERTYKIPIFLILLLMLCVFLIFSTGIITKHSYKEQQTVLESAIQRSIVQCYALEGRYPENIEYLEKHYGLTYDDTKFQLTYHYTNSHIMPEVTVIPVQN
jgi:hypothetical protein